jgi:hypothetical protein
VHVERVIKGIRAGRDSRLEKASSAMGTQLEISMVGVQQYKTLSA